MKHLSFLILLILSFCQLFAEGGTITGKVIDAVTNDEITGAYLLIVNTTAGTESGTDGRFRLSNIKPGKVKLKAMMVGYTDKIIDVETAVGRTEKIEIRLNQSAVQMQAINVEAAVSRDNSLANITERKNASSISDAISSEEISKSGSSDAAAAMKQVAGATIVGGKYVYVRGLGERYSSTHLNGVELPSTDPDKKAFQMDMISSSILDNIVTIKSFTPDKPGNFSGGIVDIMTKNHPDGRIFKVSSSTSYNNTSNLNNEFLMYSRSKTDWLGFDNGQRGIPSAVGNQEVPDFSQCIFVDANDREAISRAYRLSSMSKSFSSEMAPKNETMPVNQSHSLTYGDNYDLFGSSLGFIFTGSYSNNYSFYKQGLISKYRLTSQSANALNKEYAFDESKGEDNVNINGLLNMDYQIDKRNNLGLNVIYSRSGISTARFISGHYYDGRLDSTATYETRVLKYSQRELSSYQLTGKNEINFFDNIDVNWTGSYTNSLQDEPDMRFFTDDYSYNSEDSTTDYSITTSLYNEPSRYFRVLKEDSYGLDLKFSYPVTSWTAERGLIKTGIYYSYKSRKSTENVYKFKNQNATLPYVGNNNSYFQQGNMGIIDSVRVGNYMKYIYGNYLVDASENRNNYDGSEDIRAAFLMTELPLYNSLKFVGGLRVESTEMQVATKDTSYGEGRINEVDYLPSVNLIYNFNDKFNMRGSYGRTLARPNMRELALFPSFDFVGGFFFIGNDSLRRTLIDNFDLRLEYFDRLGELYAVSLFYKDFTDPIEKVIIGDNNEMQYQNVDQAKVAGVELELRKNLDFISPILSDFGVNMNFSFIFSEVDIAESEVKENGKHTRELQGQSPYIFNIGLNYNNQSTETGLTVNYGTYGKRLSEVSMGSTPNIYELPSHNLDLIASQSIWKGISLKMSAKNLIDQPVKKVYEYQGREYVNNQNSKGRSYSFSLNYSF